uniref:Uncharacterized protein n=1 Tax=Heterorhabditis bacteriophora TaxID=37862 RepID=A0A1I7X3D7_HETBA
MIAPSDSGMIQLGKDGPVKREQIKNDDVQKWRNDVCLSRFQLFTFSQCN